ncbi:MAG TPA: transposase family protein [Anaerolineales bacterium]|nr:transposase family protein [Anaerolineales bacterium]
MKTQPVGSILKHFEELPDPRTGNAKAHIFLEILVAAIFAVICGADGWSDVELFGKNKNRKSFKNVSLSGCKRLKS